MEATAVEPVSAEVVPPSLVTPASNHAGPVSAEVVPASLPSSASNNEGPVNTEVVPPPLASATSNRAEPESAEVVPVSSSPTASANHQGAVSAEVLLPPAASASANHQPDDTVEVKSATPNGDVTHSPSSATPAADGSAVAETTTTPDQADSIMTVKGGGDAETTTAMPYQADSITPVEEMEVETTIISSTLVVNNQEEDVVRTETNEAVTEPTQVVPDQCVRTESVKMTETDTRTESIARIDISEAAVRTEVAVAVVSSVTSDKPVSQAIRVDNLLERLKPSEGSSVEPPASSLVIDTAVENSNSIVPQECETVESSEPVDRTPSEMESSPSALVISEALPVESPQVISTTQGESSLQQGDDLTDNEEPAQIMNKPVSALLASGGSSRKNRRKASRPMQINRVASADVDMDTSSQEESNDVNIESMIDAASDITDFCSIANRFIGGDDDVDESNSTSPIHSTSSTPSQLTPSDHQSVPVQEMAKVAVAHQQNIPLNPSQSVSITKPQIIRQSSSLLPIRSRQPPSLRASPGATQQRPQRQSSPRIIYKVSQPVQQQFVMQGAQQQQIMQQQPQQFIMQQPVQGMVQGNIIQSGVIQQQPSMIVQQQQPQQQQQAVIQQGTIMTQQTGIINQQVPFVQQAVPQQMMTITQQAQPQQQQTVQMVQKPSTPPAATGNVTTGRPGQTILVLQRGDTLKLDARGNLVVVGKGDPPAGASSAPSTPTVQQQQQQVQPTKPMNVMQHTAVRNIVQMQGNITQQQPAAAPKRVQAPVVNVPTQAGVVQSPQLTSMLVQQPQQSKLHQQLTAQRPQASLENQIAVQGRLIAKGPSEGTSRGGNIFFTPSTQAPFQMVASKSGQVVKMKMPASFVSQAGANAQGQRANVVSVNNGSPINQRTATVMIKAVANTVAANKSNSVRVIDEASLAKNSSGDITLLQCDKCKKLFVSKESLVKHLETEKHMETSQDVQDGEKRFQCSACNETFVYKSSLTLHENRLCSKQPWTAAGQSSPYNFVCGICKLRFKFKPELEVHMVRVHLGQQAPVEKTPLTVSSWGTLLPKELKPAVQQDRPPLITKIKIEPGTLPKIKSNTVGTSPHRGRGRPRKHPPPPGMPVNKAGTILAPEGHKLKVPARRGRLPKNAAASAAAVLVAAAAGRKSPGRGRKKRRYSRPSADDDDDHDHYGDDGEVAYVVKDEKATTRYLCTTHGIYDANNPRPHRCNLCPKGFLSQHCLLEHIKTHIKPFWCSACGWKSSRKDNVMRHIELHHAGPKYKAKRKSPSNAKKARLEEGVMDDIQSDDAKARLGEAVISVMGEIQADDVQADDDLIDYQAQAEEETMDTNEAGGDEDVDVDVGGNKETIIDTANRPEIESNEDNNKADAQSEHNYSKADALSDNTVRTEAQNEQAKTVLNKESPHEPDKQPSPDDPDKQLSPDEGAADAIKEAKAPSPSEECDVAKPSLEESMVSSTTNHFLGFSSQTGSQTLHTNPETSAIQRPDINNRACLGGEKKKTNQGLTRSINKTNSNSYTDTKTDEAKGTDTGAGVHHKDHHEVVVETVLAEMITAIVSGDHKDLFEKYLRISKEIMPASLSTKEVEEMEVDERSANQVSTDVIETPIKDLETPRKDMETPIKDLETQRKDTETLRKDIETPQKDEVVVLDNIESKSSEEVDSEPPYAALLGDMDECIAYLIDEMITSIEESEEDDVNGFSDMDGMDSEYSQDIESIDDDGDDDDVVMDDDDDGVISGVEEIDDDSNQENDVTTNQEVATGNQEVAAGNQEIATGNEEVAASNQKIAAINHQVAATNQEVVRAENTSAASNSEVAEVTTNQSTSVVNVEPLQNQTVSSKEQMNEDVQEDEPVVFQLAPDFATDEENSQNQLPETVNSEAAPSSLSVSNVAQNGEQEIRIGSKPAERAVLEEADEVMILEDVEQPDRVADVIDVASDDEQMMEPSVAGGIQSRSLPSPPPLISTAQSSILGRKTLTKRSSGILDTVLERLEPKTELSTEETEANALKKLEQDATKVIENAEKELMQQRLSEAGGDDEVIAINASEGEVVGMSANEGGVIGMNAWEGEVVGMNQSEVLNKEQLPVISSVTSLRDVEKPPSPSFGSTLGHSVANIMGSNDARMVRPQQSMIPGQVQPYPMPPGFDPRYMQQPDDSFTIQWRPEMGGTDPCLMRPEMSKAVPRSMRPEMSGTDPRLMRPEMSGVDPRLMPPPVALHPGMPQPVYDPRYMTPQQVAMMRQGYNPNVPAHMQQHPRYIRNPMHMPNFVDPRMQQYQGMPRASSAEPVPVPSSPTLIQGVQYSQAQMVPNSRKSPPTPVAVAAATDVNALGVVPQAGIFNDGCEQVMQMQPNGVHVPTVMAQPNQVDGFVRASEQRVVPPNVTVAPSISAENSRLKQMLSSVPDPNANYASTKAATATPVEATMFQPGSHMNGEIPHGKEPAFSPTIPVGTEHVGILQHRRHSSGSSKSSKRWREKAISPDSEARRKSTSSSGGTHRDDPDFDITERPYICHICGKGFKRRNNLCDHVRIHSRPYKCGECNFGTTRWQYLAEHMRKTHGFEADDKEFEKLFKDSGKKLKPTDYIPETSLMPVTAREPSGGSEDPPSQALGAGAWTNSGTFNRRESLTTNDSDLVDFYGQVEETTFVSPAAKPIKKSNMRRAAMAAENLINKVTKEDAENDNQVLIQPVTLAKSKQKASEAEWQAFIGDSVSETSCVSDMKAEVASETTESQQEDAQSQSTDMDASSIAPSVDVPSVSSVEEQFHHQVDTDEEDSIVSGSSHQIKQEQAWDEEPMETDKPIANHAQPNENHALPPEGEDTRDTEISGSVGTQSDSIARNNGEDDDMSESFDNEDEDSMNINEPNGQENGESMFTASGRPRRRSSGNFKIHEDIRDLYDEDYTPHSYQKKKTGLVMKINLKTISGVRGRGRGRPRGRGRGRSVAGIRGPTAAVNAVREVVRGRGGKLGGRGREENRVNQMPDEDVPIKTNSEGGIDLIQYYTVVDDRDRPFQCSVLDCRKQFKSKQHMREHLFTHLRPYKCDICGLGFARTDYLGMHMKDDHNIKATKEQLFEKRKLANARAMVCRSRPSKDRKRQELYEILNSP